MPATRKIRRALFGALLAAAAVPTAASAKIIELGVTEKPPTPSCPGADCLAVTRTTGYQGKIEGKNKIFQVPRDGRIVAWTVVLGKPSSKQVKFFQTLYGGEPEARITVFTPGKHYLGTIAAQSPVRQLTDYLGERVQFPLSTTIPVKKDQRVALTVPTWAPALAIGLPGSTSWRASRDKDECDDNSTQTAQQTIGADTTFGCRYKTARLTYNVTIVTEPKSKKKKSKR